MREARTPGHGLLLIAISLALLSLLLPWWTIHDALDRQMQQLPGQLPSLQRGTEGKLPAVPGIRFYDSEPATGNPAWWFGQAAEIRTLSDGGTTLYARPDTEMATSQWLRISVPLAIAALLLPLWLRQRCLRETRQRHQALCTLLQQPPFPGRNNADPLAEEITALHHRYLQQIDQLRQERDAAQLQCQQDNLTGLGNRLAFRRDLIGLLDNENRLASATLMLIRASALQDINSRRGFPAGDQYLQDISRLVRKVIQVRPGAHAYRISGSDLAVLCPGQCETLAKAVGPELQQELFHYQDVHELESAAYIGFTQLLPGQSPESALIRVDSALAQAQSGKPNGWQMILKSDDDEGLGESHWRQRLQGMLDGDNIRLMVQPARLLKPSEPGYNEIFTHFPDDKGGVYPAFTVFAMLQRLGMSMLFEQKIIEMTLRQASLSKLPNQRWAINLTPASLQQSSFLIWLERVLMRDAAVTSSLVFELDEHVIEHQLSSGKRLIEMIRRSGARSAISKFGHGYGSFRLLKQLKPDYIKLDPQLVRHLEDDDANQQFVRMIIDLAQRLGCRVVAEGVETDDQKRQLETMYIDGVQGYLISKPVPLDGFKGLMLTSA